MTKVRKLGATLMLSVLASSNVALADGTTAQTVSQIEYMASSGSAPQLNLRLSGGGTYLAAPGYNPGCTGTVAPTVETVKIWISMAQAAMLSGKKIVAYYVVCGPNYLTDLVVLP
jgi:hypothetical protein